jgi:uncharacterized protein (TIGR02452 family)
MNNIALGKEAVRITKEKRYIINGNIVKLPDVDYEEVIVITPDEGMALLSDGIGAFRQEKMCNISVVNMDSYQAGRQYENALVMNFANAHNPGGGFLMGATAQEESLCRCSTLYASINSLKASEMYRYNNTHLNCVESDYMLISQNVAVFRDENYNLTEPVMMSVVTVPAPNRRGAAMLASQELIEDTFRRRIRIMLLAAANYQYKNLILGAWGCGAFGNSAEKVAGYFKDIIVTEEYGNCFENICFAIYGRENGRNITAFRELFG